MTKSTKPAPITVEPLQYGLANCYLVKQDGASMLVDTGTPAIADKLYERVKGENLRVIVLTHGHIDHVGNAAMLQKRLGVPIAMHSADVELSHDNSAHPSIASRKRNALIRRFFESMFKEPIEPFKVDVLLKPGDSLAQYGIDAKIISLCGHTQGSIGVVLGRSQPNDDLPDADPELCNTEIIIGDAIMNMLSPTTPYVCEDIDATFARIAELKSSGAKLLYPGHGIPLVPSTLRKINLNRRSKDD